MSKFNASQIQWREPWLAILPEYAPKAEAELYREMCSAHVLFGQSVKAIGRRQDCDDILFYVGESKFAVVHLTFQPETRPEWPHTRLFQSIEDWINQCMIPDAEDFAS